MIGKITWTCEKCGGHRHFGDICIDCIETQKWEELDDKKYLVMTILGDTEIMCRSKTTGDEFWLDGVALLEAIAESTFEILEERGVIPKNE